MRRSSALLAAALVAAVASRAARAEEPSGAAPPAAAGSQGAAAAPAEAPPAPAAADVVPAAAPADAAPAAAPAGSGPTGAAARAEPQPAPAAPLRTGLRRRLPRFGVSIGGGFPDLVNANLLFRPLPWVRLYAGPCWSYVSWGAQAGVVLAPWSSWVTPTLSFQAGKLFGTDLRRFVKSDSQSAQDIKPLLGDVGFQYLAGDLGLEFGSPRGLAFFFRLGLSFVAIEANGTTTHTSSDGTRVTLRDPRLDAWMPSAKLGFQYWF